MSSSAATLRPRLRRGPTFSATPDSRASCYAKLLSPQPRGTSRSATAPDSCVLGDAALLRPERRRTPLLSLRRAPASSAMPRSCIISDDGLRVLRLRRAPASSAMPRSCVFSNDGLRVLSLRRAPASSAMPRSCVLSDAGLRVLSDAGLLRPQRSRRSPDFIRGAGTCAEKESPLPCWGEG